MAFKIGGQKAVPEEEPMVEEMPAESMEPEAMMPEASGGLVAPEAARYFGPESRCEGCVHFLMAEMGSCEIVSGPIDPQGVCSLFTPDQMLEEAPLPDGEVMPELPTGPIA
jgi:hypothetical protein